MEAEKHQLQTNWQLVKHLLQTPLRASPPSAEAEQPTQREESSAKVEAGLCTEDFLVDNNDPGRPDPSWAWSEDAGQGQGELLSSLPGQPE